MAVALMQHELAPTVSSSADCALPCTVGELNRDNESEVLEFLAANPLHTVFMASLIRDNGLNSPHNRGSFYACRDRVGQLEAVALIGHATLIDARTKASMAAFARLAGNCPN